MNQHKFGLLVLALFLAACEDDQAEQLRRDVDKAQARADKLTAGVVALEAKVKDAGL